MRGEHERVERHGCEGGGKDGAVPVEIVTSGKERKMSVVSWDTAGPADATKSLRGEESERFSREETVVVKSESK